MDPYLEGQLWPDVHQELASAIRRQLVPHLRPGYVARLSVRTVKDSEPEEEIGVMYPDVGVFRDQGRSGEGVDDPTVGTITPATITIPTPAPVSVRLVRVELRFVKTNRLVTAIEVLSPVNKRGTGLREYRRKRERLRAARVHLLEIDLLRRGRRVVPSRRVPDCDYLVSLTRARSGVADLWPLSIHDPLPIVPVPLRKDDGDVPLELGAALTSAYNDAAYQLSIDYSQPPPPPPLSPDDAEWVRQVTRR
jgi:hypothetical protein